MTDFLSEATPEDPDAGIAAELGEAGFEDAEEVGRGGFGTVYRCLQRSLGRVVAIKVLSSGLDRENRERFLREEYVMGRLSGHPNIVTVLQVGVISGGRPYIVMPYCLSDSLEARIRREGALEWSSMLRIGVKVAGALETAHRAGILHRDIKPANILMTDFGEPQLTDFGIARMTGRFETYSDAVAGSLAFIAPEILGGAAPTAASDVYSLGATLFCLVAGHAAFERQPGEEVVAQFLRITSQPVPDLRSAGVPDDVCAVIERAIARDRSDRPASAAELGEALRELERRAGLRVDEMALPVHRPEDHAPEPAHASATQPAENRQRYSAERGESIAQRQVIRGRIKPPPLPTPMIPRPRVEGLLTHLIEDYPVVCIYATAGSGKTTAVLQSALATRRPLAWLSVARTDVATGQLLTYLEAALASQVPSVCGVATAAMAAGVPHPEVAGLLAEAIGESTVLFVIDDLERLGAAENAVAVLETFLRYLPATARAVLIGRTEVPVDLGSGAIRATAGVGEGELAFTLDEASQALAAAGSSQIDPDAAMKATGGWVAGILFEAWRSADHVPGMGGQADPLHGYLSTQILGQLPPNESDFLVATSVLDQVTSADAEALGLANARALLRALHGRHLPASWEREGHILRCHPRFREYLLELLEMRPEAEVREIRRRHAALMARKGHYEEAVTEYLEAGALEQALIEAEHCLEAVAERADMQLAEQWLEALAPVRASRRQLASAELMLAVGSENYRRALDLADQLAADNELEEVARSSSRAGALMSWSYMHAGELAKARAVLDVTPPGPPLDAMRYCLTLMDENPPAAPPTRALCGDSFDALVMRVHYYRGYFGLIMEHQLTGWAERVGESWRIGALLDMGSTEEALRLFEASSGAVGEGVWFSGILAVKVMSRLGRLDDARQALQVGRARIRQSGSLMLEMFSYLEEADMEIRLGNDIPAARAALSRVLSLPATGDYLFVREHALTSLAMILLRDGDADGAAARLREVVEAANRGDRVYSLAHAGVYLAEAEWRLGNPESADRAADVALDAARRQGTNYSILQAITEFPAVLSRRLDAEEGRDSPWHALARAWEGTTHGPVHARLRSSIVLAEFGRLGITVNGTEVKPRIKKSYELLAYLIDRQKKDVSREELLDALFAGQVSDSNSSYLRQAIHHLRHVLPDEMTLEKEKTAGRLRFDPEAAVTSESVLFEELSTEAAALRGEQRLDAILRALALIDRGSYLPGVKSAWAEQHRSYLRDRAVTIRFEAADTAYALDQLGQAEELVERVVREDPFREGAYRLMMKLADSAGDEDRVVAAYRRCEQALRDIGATPSSATQQLFTRLHR